MGRPSVEQIRALAPDAGSLAAASALARPGPWSDSGCDDRAVWGACRGSAREPYHVVCDVGDLGFRCTCPSRKSPCKHVLALLFLWAAGSTDVPAAAAPPVVAAWIGGRPLAADAVPLAESLVDQRGPNPLAGRRVVAPPRAPADPEAAAARSAQRVARIRDGMAELDLWLRDLLRHGLGWAQPQPYSFWDGMAARLVDAQAPGAAARVRDLAGVVRSGEDWAARLLASLSRLHLLAAGWARWDELPDVVRADLRTAAGWPWPSEQVLAGPREQDRWYVLGRVVSQEEQVSVQRTWLWGLDRSRTAVVVDFARPGAAFAWELWPGYALEASVARFPGSAAQRVLIAERQGEPEAAGPPPGWPGLVEMSQARARAVATDPWSDRFPVSVGPVVPHRSAAGWKVVDRAGLSLPLAVDEVTGLRLAAVSGGRGVHLVGEWVDEALAALGVWAEERMVML